MLAGSERGIRAVNLKEREEHDHCFKLAWLCVMLFIVSLLVSPSPVNRPYRFSCSICADEQIPLFCLKESAAVGLCGLYCEDLTWFWDPKFP